MGWWCLSDPPPPLPLTAPPPCPLHALGACLARYESGSTMRYAAPEDTMEDVLHGAMVKGHAQPGARGAPGTGCSSLSSPSAPPRVACRGGVRVLCVWGGPRAAAAAERGAGDDGAHARPTGGADADAAAQCVACAHALVDSSKCPHRPRLRTDPRPACRFLLLWRRAERFRDEPCRPRTRGERGGQTASREGAPDSAVAAARAGLDPLAFNNAAAALYKVRAARASAAEAGSGCRRGRTLTHTHTCRCCFRTGW